MRRIMLWSLLRPFNEASTEAILLGDMIGGNTGNLFFTDSIVRALMTSNDDVFDRCFGRISDAQADAINEQYECFVMPLANAFRSNYIDKLEHMTRLVNRLSIPCVVTGVGIQVPSSVDLSRTPMVFDDAARNFMRAVLKKSAIVGVRGRRTAAYLKRLGFVEDQDFTVIGCPSMYLHGPTLPEIRQKPFSKNARVAINGKADSSGRAVALLNDFTRELTNWTYIPQTLEELLMLRYGARLRPGFWARRPEYVPRNRRHPLVREDRCVAFFNVPSWLDALADYDFVCGSNIHGCVAGIQAGVPALVVVPDQRVAEIVEYYDLPALDASDTANPQTVMDAISSIDPGPMQRGYARRFAHFVEFLDQNGLDHIYKPERANQPAPYDARVRAIHGAPPLRAPAVLTADDRRVAARLNRKMWKRLERRAIEKARQAVQARRR